MDSNYEVLPSVLDGNGTVYLSFEPQDDKEQPGNSAYISNSRIGESRPKLKTYEEEEEEDCSSTSSSEDELENSACELNNQTPREAIQAQDSIWNAR